MKKNPLQIVAYGVVAISLLVGIVYLLISIWKYPGGTAFQSGREGFHFGQNLLSDLGRSKLYGQALENPSSPFFSKFLYWGGIAVSIMQFLWWTTIREHQARIWGGAAFLLMFSTAFHAIGLSLYSIDEHIVQFDRFYYRMLLSLAGSLVASGIAIAICPKPDRIRIAWWWGSGLLVFFYGVMYFYSFGPWYSEGYLLMIGILEKITLINAGCLMVHHFYLMVWRALSVKSQKSS